MVLAQSYRQKNTKCAPTNRVMLQLQITINSIIFIILILIFIVDVSCCNKHNAINGNNSTKLWNSTAVVKRITLLVLMACKFCLDSKKILLGSFAGIISIMQISISMITCFYVFFNVIVQ